MPLADPPAPATLAGLPARRTAGHELHRVHRRDRASPWWFRSLDPERPLRQQGRFDLPAPDGTCYLARSKVAAVLEVFQEHDGLLPDVELRERLRAEVTAPATAPDAADVAARVARGAGVTAALWAGGERLLTQRWAVALRRAGWLAVHHGIQHDPSGSERAVALFDHAGEHSPYDDVEGWATTSHELADDDELRGQLAAYGIEVVRSDPQLPEIGLDESGLT
jgi:hypothetical protein